MAVTFDKLVYVESLKAGGVDEKAAKAAANALDVALRETVATRHDIDEVKHDVALIRKDMDAMEDRMIVKVGGMMVVAVGVLAILMKVL